MKQSRIIPLPELDPKDTKTIFIYAKTHWRRVGEMSDSLAGLVTKIIDQSMASVEDLASDDLDAVIGEVIKAWKEEIIKAALAPKKAVARKTRGSTKSPAMTIANKD